MTPFTRKLLSACVASLLGFTAPGAAWAKAPARASVARQASTAPTASGRAYHYDVSTTYAYRWDTWVRMATYAEDDQRNVSEGDTYAELHGTVGVRAVRQQTDGSYLLEVRLYDVTGGYLAETGYTDAKAGDLEKALNNPMYFEQQPNGQVSAVYVDPAESGTTLNFKRGIASALQTLLDADATPPITETDVSGIYRPRYEVIDERERVTFRKSRTQAEYERFADPNAVGHDFSISTDSTAVFEPKWGVLTSIEAEDNYTSSVSERDDADGVATWSVVNSKGSLSFLGTDKLPPSREEPDLSRFVQTSLVADYSEAKSAMAPTQSTSTLTTDLAALEQSPDDPARFRQLVETLRASPKAVLQLCSRLRDGAVAPQALTRVYNALAAVGTPDAQRALTRHMGQLRDQRDDALLALALVARPTAETVDAVERLSADSRSPSQQQAVVVLGALANRILAQNPFRAAVAAQRLEQGLRAATSTEQQVIYLSAMGNAGTAVSLDTIAPFLRSEEPAIRASALEALRKHPAAAIAPYAQSAMLDRDAMVRATAQTLEMSPAGAPPQQLGWDWGWGWDKHFGGKNLGGEAFVAVESHSDDNITLNAEARLYGWLLKHRYELAGGTFQSYMNANNTKRVFFGMVALAGLFDVPYYEEVPCSSSDSGTLYDMSADFVTAGYQLPLFWGISLSLSFESSGTVKLPYTFEADACNAPSNAQASAKLTPVAYMNASGGVGVNLILVEVGAGADATLMKGTAKGRTEGTWASSKFTACLTVSASIQPLNGKIYLYAKPLFFPKYKWTLTSFSTNTYSKTIFDDCM